MKFRYRILSLLLLPSLLLSCNGDSDIIHVGGTDPGAIIFFMKAADAYQAKDFPTAFKFFNKSSKLGLSGADYRIGLMYAEGKGVPKNLVQASLWYTRAAVEGLEIAQLKMGAIHLEGEGVVQDYGQAAFWLLKASAKGNAESQNMLGHLYLKGQGVEKDIITAYAWFYIAAESKFTKDDLNKLIPSMSKAQIEKGKNLISEMLEDNPRLIKAVRQEIDN